MLIFADYNLAFSTAVKIIEKYNLNDLPIDIFALVKKFKKIRIETYSNLIKKNNCSIQELIEEFGSELGFCAYDEVYGNAVIYYNDKKNIRLIRFTIAHELAHYLLNHFERADSGIISKKILSLFNYESLEKESDCFARNLLSPASLVYIMNITDPVEIKNIFKVTFKASKARVDFYKEYDYKYLNNKMINFFKKRFHKYLKRYEVKICSKCHNEVPITGIKYCPVCGYDKYKRWGEVKSVVYSGAALDFNHKAVICPRCLNEEINTGNYCKICGAYLINKCYGEYNDFFDEFHTNGCGELAEGDARYCHKCGKQTTFGYFKLLKHWEEEKDQKPNNLYKLVSTVAPNLPYAPPIYTEYEKNDIFRFEEVSDDLPF